MHSKKGADMSNQMDVDPGRLGQHAAEHQSIAAAWKEWSGGAEAFLASLRLTHGPVAEPVIRVLEQYQQRRARFAGDQSEMNQGVADALTENLVDYQNRETASSKALTAPVQGL